MVLSLALMIVGFAGWALWRATQLPAGTGFEIARLGEPDGITLLLLTMLATGGPALLLWRWRRWPTRLEWRDAWQALSRLQTWAWCVGIAALVALMNAGIGHVLEAMHVNAEPSNQALLLRADAEAPWFLALFAVLIAPAYEELLFRRVLLGRFLQAGAPMLGLLFSSALFATAHEVPGLGGNPMSASLVLWSTYAVMGLAFGEVYRRTGSLPAAIATHGLHNAIALWWLPH
jgi:membrane protease YdiL (CAAX protease family)